MKADRIIKNAAIFTSDKDNPQATALAVKDGKFIYVGDEAGLSAFEGPVTDLGGRFIMPGIIDSHLHITSGVAFEYAKPGERIECEGKQTILDYMADFIRKNPGQERYRFSLEKKRLKGEELVKEDLDAICPDAELQILEGESHSTWVNSRILERHHITDETPDPVPGLSFYERKDGHVTGNLMEITAQVPILFDSAMDYTDEQIDAAIQRWIDFSVKHGVTACFDAGNPAIHDFEERVYDHLRALDEQGKLPVHVEGCFVVAAQWEVEKGIKELKRYREKYNTRNMKINTMKIFMDGTKTIHTAAMVTPYEGTDELGATAFNVEDLAEVIKKLNAEGLNLHLHTIGDRASRMVLDAVELARKALGDSYCVKVTTAHLEIQDDADLMRFARLGVIANFTPHWHAGDMSFFKTVIGSRASKMFRCKTLWDSGALVTWSSDTNAFSDFTTWNPYLGMEVGMTRWITEKTKDYEYTRIPESFPPAEERMSIEEMILGYTINGAKQLGIDDCKGSITVGKDADFLVFDNDLLTAEHEGFSFNKPTDVYLFGRKMN